MASRGNLVACFLVMVISSLVIPPLVFGQGTAVSLAFDLQGASVPVCWYWAVGFQASQGEEVGVQWSESGFPISSPTSLDVYIAPLTVLHQNWYCTQGPVYLYYDSGAFGSLQWEAPSAGNFAVYVVNYHWDPVMGTVTINAENVSAIGYFPARASYYCMTEFQVPCYP